MPLRKLASKGSPFKSATAVGTATFVIGAENTNVINVGIQLKDADGTNLTTLCAVGWYLSANADGSTLAAAPSGGTAIGTDGLLIENIAERAGTMISKNNGHIDINITESTAKSFYLVLIMPDGSLVVSAAITFA